MNGLIACECSGIVKTAFRAKGHNFYSCDVKPSEIMGDKYHIQDDIRDVLKSMWAKQLDFLGAHPDCSKLANSGARWLFEKEGRWQELREAAEFFNYFKKQDIPKKYIENPQPHKWATELIGKYSIKVQPYWFGDKFTKGVCLWLFNLPPLFATHYIPPPKNKEELKKWQAVWREPPGDNQKTNRARTYASLAQAMAEQWGNL